VIAGLALCIPVAWFAALVVWAVRGSAGRPWMQAPFICASVSLLACVALLAALVVVICVRIAGEESRWQGEPAMPLSAAHDPRAQKQRR
jgi:hypothetical protein